MITVTRAAVREDGRHLARLSYCGEVITLIAPDGSRPGRIMPAGYLTGERRKGLYEAWTAKHPMVYVPSDKIITESPMTLEQCAAFILGTS